MMPAAPHPIFDELISWVTVEVPSDELSAAKAEWFQRTGEVFEDDRQLEARMGAFLEYFVCDLARPTTRVTPARQRYELALTTESPARAAAFRPFTETRHGLFEVRRLKPGVVRLRGLFSGADVEVTERRLLVGLSVGDVIEARLVPSAGTFYFLPAHCWHPHQAAAGIRAEAARRRAAGLPERELVWECAQRSLKADRYRQIPLDKIYEFSAS